MIMYKFLIAVYIDEKDTEKLKDLCVNNYLEFEDDPVLLILALRCWMSI